HVHWTALRADACPLELRASERFSARPCLTASIGALFASAVIQHPENREVFWSTLGAGLQLSFRLTRALQLDAASGLDAPLVHDHFHFRPSTPVYEVPASMEYAALGFAVRFE